jgi:cell division GTPase FtsZ
MKLAVVGFGNAGGKITDRIVEYETQTERSLCRFTAVVNSARIDLQKLEYVPQRSQILVGETDERSKGHGAGADPDLGAELTRQDLGEVQRVLDNVPLHDVDAFLVIAGLGGGTGSGGGPVFAEALGERYGEPVYGLGVLPSGDEGGRASLNAARSIRSFVDSTDATIAFDNDAWREGTQSIESGYEQTNLEIAKRIVALLAPGEYDGSPVSENAMDSSDVKRTLSVGGVATIAYAEASLEDETQRQRGLLGRLRNDGESEEVDGAATKVHGLVRRAARSRLTCPADISSAERALIVVSGPPSELSQKGLVRARKWLESQIDSVEVLAGDDPRPAAEKLRATVLLANATDVPRIDALQQQAVDAQENIDEQAAERETAISELVTDPDDDLDPI